MITVLRWTLTKLDHTSTVNTEGGKEVQCVSQAFVHPVLFSENQR